MNRILHVIVSECLGCPHHKWEPNDSYSNHFGWSVCSKVQDNGSLGRYIEQDNKRPQIPEWCLLPKEAVSPTEFIVYDWAGSVGEKRMTSLGYTHHTVVKGNIYEHAQRCYESGLKVMLFPASESGALPVLYLDTKRFGQR